MFRLEVRGNTQEVEAEAEAKGRLIKIILRREVYHVWLESYYRFYVAGIVYCL